MKKLYLLFPIILFLPLPSSAIDSIDDLSVISHWTCDETSGVRYDSNTVTGVNLTDNNTVSYQTGLLSNACDFESSNSEYLSATGLTAYDFGTGNFSISYWIKVESDGTKQNGLRGFILYGDANHYIRFYLTTAYDEARLFESPILSTNTYGGSFGSVWIHVVLVRDGNTLTLYHNASSVGSFSTSGGSISSMDFSSLGTLQIGGQNVVGAAEYYDGLFDEITIDNEAWSTSTISAVYNSGTPLPYHYEATSSSTATSTATSTTATDSDTHFLLSIIIFFLSIMVFGWAFSMIRKQ